MNNETESAQPRRPLRLSVLDQSPVPEGATRSEALRNTIDLAQRAEELGYFRYWVAEHHATPALACASPEAIIGPIAAATSVIRVGSGGVMLPHYSPFKVAETFSMLSGLYPGRIDLGIGRAPGSDAATAIALQRNRRQRSPDDFFDQLSELLGYIRGDLPADHPFARLSALFNPSEVPEPWLLGSSPQSGIWAADLGLPYAFADFIHSGGGPDIAEYYRQHFRPSSTTAVPRTAVAAWVICADTDAEAERLAASSRMLLTLLHRGRLIPVPKVETGLRFFESEGLQPETPPGRRVILGSPSIVRNAIEALADEYAAEEVMIVNILYDHAARKRSYELVASAFELQSSSSTPDRSLP